jgi:rare lipoprotein A
MLKFIISSAIATATLISTSAFASETMLSSWYGGYFHGRTTANGEIYDMYGHTAAHKTLPFGTKLEVCYKRCTTVRINDRGPFIGVRELDLSYGAAKAIGLINPGVANVEVNYLN